MNKLISTALLAALAIGTVAPALANDVNIEANGQTYAFKPSVVMLKKGRTTTLHFKATPGAPHGINVPELGINNVVITGAGTTVTVTPKKTGTYAAHCTIVCGSGHAHMAMKFVVS